jgi:hypothetical protein
VRERACCLVRLDSLTHASCPYIQKIKDEINKLWEIINFEEQMRGWLAYLAKVRVV